ncbi:MAG TPA: HAMP domain-containing sensor histidine kinase [Lacipirellulaceae bacterium]|nr:HAMP domain-containing sensor histidine kinase [Lacipirellulaceae bacterium]
MKRPWQIWTALAACGLVMAAAMAWLSLHALRADRDRSAARADADLEQRVSLALWQMDTKLAPLIAEESARPHFFYSPALTVEAPRSKAGPAIEQVASPLVTNQSPSVLLNFNAAPDGAWSSPQAPEPELEVFLCANGATMDGIAASRARLQELAANITVEQLLEQLPLQPLPRIPSGPGNRLPSPTEFGNAAAPSAAPGGEQSNQFYANASAAEQLADADPSQSGTPPSQDRRAAPANGQGGQTARGFSRNNSGEAIADLTERNQRYQQQVEQQYVKQRLENHYRVVGPQDSATAAVESASRPLWVGDRLLLARRVVVGGATIVQGSWLNWPKIKADLLADAADVLPAADLVAVGPNDRPDPTRMLAGLPVRLVAAPAPPASASTPLHWALGVGWGALALALLAIAGLLWGVMALSERRAAFVSSVTHELRTPLTTFRLYSEMLARDMAPTPERRREYLDTLRTEADRLTHLVENVLAYARLERGRRPRRAEHTTPAALLARFGPRLAERASQSQMTLESSLDPATGAATLVTDLGVVEQILFNLVDNAAKYANRAADRTIHLEIRQRRGFVEFAVRDHGPGFPSPRAAAHVRAFSKSAEEAAESAPGVGLGLALCRRLARELGGRLDVGAVPGEAGAIVALHLPTGA